MNDDEKYVANIVNDVMPPAATKVTVVANPDRRVSYTITIEHGQHELDDAAVLKALTDADFDTDMISYTFTYHFNYRECPDGPYTTTYTYTVTDYLS